MMRTHAETPECRKRCAVHSPSDHHMKRWRLNWRSDIRVMERLCRHNVGHPDPDHLTYVGRIRGVEAAEVDGVHGCDGCCVSPDEQIARQADRVIQENHERGAPLAAVREHLAEEKQTFEGGSTRSAKLERYDLIPPEIDNVLALRFGLGAEKHGEFNWQGGGSEFIRGCLNHLRAHYVSLLTHGPFHDDDDIGAMIWNAGVLAWFRVHKPDEFLKALKLDPTHSA